MRVLPLQSSGCIYTSNAYLVLGDWSRIEDVNTLVDVGRDPEVLAHLDRIYTGVGKKKVERVVLTHSHYDHVELLTRIRQVYAPEILATSPNVTGVDRLLRDGEHVRLGDSDFEVITVHAHTADSVFLYNEAEGTLFAGDAPLFVQSPGGSYDPEFVGVLDRISSRPIRVVYPGHGKPETENCSQRLVESLGWIRGDVAASEAAQGARPGGK